ncbi:MAG: galactose-phosphate uridylyltransferase [Actinomycetota bacterium]
MSDNDRLDPHSGARVHIVAARQNRPNLPSSECPFCVGGLESPEPYDVKSFANRWPALETGACEVVLYSSQHDATFASLGSSGIRNVIDLWAERTTQLQQQNDVDYVLIFENRGAEVGATISHPHGQIYAFDHVPRRQHSILQSQWKPDLQPADRLVINGDHFVAYAQYAAIHPVSLVVAPHQQVSLLSQLGDELCDELASILHKTFVALDQLFDAPLPYMMWITQAPAKTQYENAWLNIEIVSPWRAKGVQRYIAAAEVSTEEYFNPVDPADIAQRLRTLVV